VRPAGSHLRIRLGRLRHAGDDVLSADAVVPPMQSLAGAPLRADSTCHSERSEESRITPRFFASLRMTCCCIRHGRHLAVDGGYNFIYQHRASRGARLVRRLPWTYRLACTDRIWRRDSQVQ
jgi:hypothetical protein